MIKVPLNDIIAKIKESSLLTDEQINAKIDEKLKQLSGLVSKEGAAHIVANELGVRVLETVSGKLEIKNIMTGMRDVESIGKVSQVLNFTEFTRKDGAAGKVCSFNMADETGSIRVVGWGEQAENVKKLVAGDVAKIIGGYVRENQGRKEVHLNDRSKLIKNPEGISVNVSVEAAAEKREKALRKEIKDLQENDSNVEVLGTIVQVFDLKFFEVCPQCNKRSRMRDNAFHCEQHGQVTPDYSYVMNLFLDDGSDNIRVVFFRNQLENLLGMDKSQVVQFKSDPSGFEGVKSDLLGKQVKIVGRVTKNQMFDRLELMSQLVFTNPDPKEEIERIKVEKPASAASKPMAETDDDASLIEEIENIN